MTFEVHDDGSDPRVAADLDGPMVDPKSMAEAGFEAGLSVVIAAMPMASIVIDAAHRVVASNRASQALITNLTAPDTASAVARAVAAAHQSGDPVTAHVPLPREGFETYLIAPLSHPDGRMTPLFLVTQAQEGAEQAPRPVSRTLLQSYEMAPAPARALREEAARFKRLSETDPLTGALNVRAFAARVTKALEDAPRRKGAMIFVDLNRFKTINDRFGHAAGDKVLIHVATKLTFPPHTWIATARMGGDEFALWMPGVERDTLETVIEGIRARMRMPVDLSAHSARPAQITPTAAIGAVCCPDEALNYDTMRHLADKRMYEDKARHYAGPARRKGKDGPKRKGAVDPAPQSFLPR